MNLPIVVEQLVSIDNLPFSLVVVRLTTTMLMLRVGGGGIRGERRERESTLFSDGYILRQSTNLKRRLNCINLLLIQDLFSFSFSFFLNNLQQPFHCEIEHRLGLNCFTSGPVSCRVRLDRGGYVPGETIGIWASVHNQSRVTIKRTKASLTEVGNVLIRLLVCTVRACHLFKFVSSHHIIHTQRL